ncbi:MAG TPA: hypothetical protein DDW28_00425, partial [Prevotella sp.]|nr:hypothetical protein [Candidatus Segatella violae]
MLVYDMPNLQPLQRGLSPTTTNIKYEKYMKQQLIKPLIATLALTAATTLPIHAVVNGGGGESPLASKSSWSLSLQGGVGFASGVDYQSVNPQYAKVAP